MAKGEAKKTNQMITSEQKRASTQQGGFYNQMLPYQQGTQNYATATRDATTGGYKNFADTGGFTPETLARLRGAVNNQDFLDARSRFQGLGNVNVARDPNLTALSQEGGGWNPESLSTVRGGYGELAKTGGWSPEDISRFRRQTADIPSATFGAMGRNLQNQARVQGIGPGYTSQTRNLMRDKQTAIDTAMRQGNIGLAESIRQGKLAGLGGLGTTESSIAGTRLGAAGQLQGASNLEAQLRQQGAIAGAEGLMGLGNLNLGNEWAIQNATTGNQLAGLGGMAGMYQATPGAYNAATSQLLQSQGLQAGTQGNLIQQHMQNNPNVSAWDRAMQVAGLGAGALKGLGGFGIPGGGGGGGGYNYNPFGIGSGYDWGSSAPYGGAWGESPYLGFQPGFGTGDWLTK